MDEKMDMEIGPVTPGQWKKMEEVFTAPAGAQAGSYQLGVWLQPDEEVITIADAFAGVVPEPWTPGAPIPKATLNLIGNPGFSRGHVTPAGWNLQSNEIGRVYPADSSGQSEGSGLCIERSNILLYADFPVQPGQRVVYSLRVKSNTPNPHVKVWPVWRKKLTLAGSNIEVPGPESPNISGYTGFNNADLQAVYACRKSPARRSQIMRGWGKPIIQRMPNGDLAATQFKNLNDRKDRNPKYPYALEESALVFSHDGGWTWGEPRLLGIAGRPAQFSILPDGTMFMATSELSWTDSGRLLRSEDGGNTFVDLRVPWEDFVTDNRPGIYRNFGETNGITRLADGTLLIVCSLYRAPGVVYQDFASYIIRSRDGGRTWGDGSFLIYTDEVELLLLPDGKLLGFARLSTQYMHDILGKSDRTGAKQVGEGGDTMALIESTDGGYTWSKPQFIGLGPAQIPSFPLLLPDGRLILTYGNRQFPFGIQAIASRDLGKTWNLENFLMLAWASWTNLGGHPRSILMPDGSIVTGYYAHYFKDHLGGNEGLDLVSHCLRWTPPADWPLVK